VSLSGIATSSSSFPTIGCQIKSGHADVNGGQVSRGVESLFNKLLNQLEEDDDEDEKDDKDQKDQQDTRRDETSKDQRDQRDQRDSVRDQRESVREYVCYVFFQIPKNMTTFLR